MRKYALLLSLLCVTWVWAQLSYQTLTDVSYLLTPEKDVYRQERCKLDIYYPEGKEAFATVVWFHGGGLTGGEKELPRELTERGFAVVSPNYRLSHRATYPAYIEDTAEAIAWVFRNIASYGGDPDKIFVGGHSAGGYLVLMAALGKEYLEKFGVDADQVAGWLPVSGQTFTHYTIRKEMGLPNPDKIPWIDRYALAHLARNGTPPIILLTGNRTLEMTARYEENATLYAVLQGVGNQSVRLYELEGFDHGNVVAPACCFIADYISKQTK
ncbi:MAG: alpha/beta hydrolase [Bacteroides sp.]|nr:alpha/beta hydrolase [Bacteroides sp.]